MLNELLDWNIHTPEWRLHTLTYLKNLNEFVCFVYLMDRWQEGPRAFRRQHGGDRLFKWEAKWETRFKKGKWRVERCWCHFSSTSHLIQRYIFLMCSYDNINTYPKVKFYIESPYTNHLVSRIIFNSVCFMMGFPYGSVGKESDCNAGDPGSIPGLGRSPAEAKGSPLHYSGLENSMGWIVHGVAKSQTWLSNFHFHFTLLYHISIHVPSLYISIFLFSHPPIHPACVLFIYLFFAVLGLSCWKEELFPCCGVQASCFRGFSGWPAWPPGHAGFRSCGPWAWLTHSTWNLPRPGIEPMSPALTGGSSTTWTTREVLPCVFEAFQSRLQTSACISLIWVQHVFTIFFL